MGKRSTVRDEDGKVVAVDIQKGDTVHRYTAHENITGGVVADKLIGVVEDDTYKGTAGTDFFGNPVWTGENTKVNK